MPLRRLAFDLSICSLNLAIAGRWWLRKRAFDSSLAGPFLRTATSLVFSGFLTFKATLGGRPRRLDFGIPLGIFMISVCEGERSPAAGVLLPSPYRGTSIRGLMDDCATNYEKSD